MQRIIIRYWKEATVGALRGSDVRKEFLHAIDAAKLPIGEGRRVVVMGPSLPLEATSEAEFLSIELVEPRDPSEVRNLLNLHLSQGLRIEQAWIARPGKAGVTPAALDEAVYMVQWPGSPSIELVRDRIARFLSASIVPLTRVRETREQHLNARAFVRDIHIVATRDDVVCLLVTIVIGPDGSLRPNEFVQLLGDSPEPGTLRVHRVALQHSSWRVSVSPRGMTAWKRMCVAC